MVDLSRELEVVFKTGKLVYGFNRVKKLLLTKRVKGIIVAEEGPRDKVEQIKYYAKLSGTPLYMFSGSSWELGRLCKKPFMISTLAILDPGESQIMKVFRGER